MFIEIKIKTFVSCPVLTLLEHYLMLSKPSLHKSKVSGNQNHKLKVDRT